MSIEVRYLVIGADRSMRVAKRPRVQPWEVAVKLTLTYPDTWGSTVDAIAIDVPDFAPTVNSQDVDEEVDEYEMDEEEAV